MDGTHAYEIYEHIYKVPGKSYALFLLKGGKDAVKWVHTGNEK